MLSVELSRFVQTRRIEFPCRYINNISAACNFRESGFISLLRTILRIPPDDKSAKLHCRIKRNNTSVSLRSEFQRWPFLDLSHRERAKKSTVTLASRQSAWLVACIPPISTNRGNNLCPLTLWGSSFTLCRRAERCYRNAKHRTQSDPSLWHKASYALCFITCPVPSSDTACITKPDLIFLRSLLPPKYELSLDTVMRFVSPW